MMGYVPDLHQIWVGTTDHQLMAILSNEFPELYRYALIMEEAFEAERRKVSRSYDGMAPRFPKRTSNGRLNCWQRRQPLERGYQAFLGSGNAKVLSSSP